LITEIQQVLDEVVASEAFKDFAEEEDDDQDGEIDARSAFDRERQRLPLGGREVGLGADVTAHVLSLRDHR
jgi:hypothetical protein